MVTLPTAMISFCYVGLFKYLYRFAWCYGRWYETKFLIQNLQNNVTKMVKRLYRRTQLIMDDFISGTGYELQSVNRPSHPNCKVRITDLVQHNNQTANLGWLVPVLYFVWPTQRTCERSSWQWYAWIHNPEQNKRDRHVIFYRSLVVLHDKLYANCCVCISIIVVGRSSISCHCCLL